MSYESRVKRAELEKKEGWDEFMNIPKFTPKEGWEIQVTPPFGGAIARFRVWNGEDSVSVYFDAFDRLGSVGQPYWEIYPNAEGDCSRYYANQTSEMMQGIAESFAAVSK